MVGIITLPHTFHFQVQKEVLHHGIIPAVALAAHAAADAVLIEQALVFKACILAATIGMQQQSRCRLALPGAIRNAETTSSAGMPGAVAQPMHFTDYQRSSPHCGQLINIANHFNCPLRHVAGFPGLKLLRRLRQLAHHGEHSLGICASLSQFTYWTQRTGEVACRSLYPCFPQVVANTTV
jgi:hypothetical protein